MDWRHEVGGGTAGNWKFWDHGDYCSQDFPCSGDLLVCNDEQWGHTERRYYDNWQRIDWSADGIESRTLEVESRIEDLERDASSEVADWRQH